MYDKSSFPMDTVDVYVLPDIIRYVLGDNRLSASLIEDETETVEDGFNPAFDNDDAALIIEDLTQVCTRVGDDLTVADCTSFTPTDSVEEDFVDLSVSGYVGMKRDYFDECHDPYT